MLLASIEGSPRVLRHSAFLMNPQIYSFSEQFQPGKPGKWWRNLAWVTFVVQVTHTENSSAIPHQEQGWGLEISNSGTPFPWGREAAAVTSFPRQRERQRREKWMNQGRKITRKCHHILAGPSWELLSKDTRGFRDFFTHLKDSHSFQHLWLRQGREELAALAGSAWKGNEGIPAWSELGNMTEPSQFKPCLEASSYVYILKIYFNFKDFFLRLEEIQYNSPPNI